MVLQPAKKADEIFNVLFPQALIESGHRATALKNRLADLRPGGWSATGQRVSTKKTVQIRRLFVQVGLLSLVTFSAVILVKPLTFKLGATGLVTMLIRWLFFFAREQT
ncbi:MAG: hypothetical protein WBV41_11705 [Terriglobales bacterium]